jgi:hypothetical protein
MTQNGDWGLDHRLRQSGFSELQWPMPPEMFALPADLVGFGGGTN